MSSNSRKLVKVQYLSNLFTTIALLKFEPKSTFQKNFSFWVKMRLHLHYPTFDYPFIYEIFILLNNFSNKNM